MGSNSFPRKAVSGRSKSIMTYEWMQPAAYLCFGLMVAVPIYLLVFRGRFWFAFFAAWFFMIAESHFSVHYRLNLLDRGLVDSASDTTSIGLMMFSGWILALPYCGILVLIRKLLKRSGVVQETGGEQDEDVQAAAAVESKP